MPEAVAPFSRRVCWRGWRTVTCRMAPCQRAAQSLWRCPGRQAPPQSISRLQRYHSATWLEVLQTALLWH